MCFLSCEIENVPVAVNVFRFRGRSGVDEYHVMAEPTDYADMRKQLQWLCQAYGDALRSLGLAADTVVLRRFFCSDLTNQAAVLEAFPFSNPGDTDQACAVSWVGQAPAAPAKVALWAYHVNDPHGLKKTQHDYTLELKRGELAHVWTAGLTNTESENSYDQTKAILEGYTADVLCGRRMTWLDHVIRTWLYVQNVDANYASLVEARRQFFVKHGLTPQTHYIASTGIEGRHVDVAAKVTMDVYSIGGALPEQVQFVQALDHLSPTDVYGVTFERATAVAYEDRKHIFVSGTASIDHRGKILYAGDVSRQLDRTIENMGVLLRQTGACLDDMCMFIVYVRDPSDFDLARSRMRERFGDAPIQVVLGPVCRPGWLIEVEGMAVIPDNNSHLPEF